MNLIFVVTTQAAVGWQQRGAVSASNQFMRQIGAAIGTASLGAVFNLGLYARIPKPATSHADDGSAQTQRACQPLDAQRYAAAIGASLHGIYIILLIISAIVLALTLALTGQTQCERSLSAA